MRKGKRAPGGGRKPEGEFARLTAALTIRMPQAMRDELEKAAKRGRRNITQELLRRLQNSFNEDRRKSRDPALRAMCYLIAEVAEGVTNPAPIGVKHLRPLWRLNPFLFRAFKLAVGKLLDALEPAGEIKPPATLEISPIVTLNLFEPKFVRDMYQTPEALADFVTAGILRALLGATLTERSKTKWEWDIYGIESARRDLNVKPTKEKKS